jgi:FHA domain
MASGTTERSTKKAAPKKPAGGSERTQLAQRLAAHLGVSEDEVQLRALRELAAREGLTPAVPDAKPTSAPQATPAAAAPAARPKAVSRGGLPQRLFLHLAGRGLEGHGMPMEVVRLPTILGSERRCDVWINSPQIETRHLQITEEDGGYVATDLGSEHGTFHGDDRVERHVISDGDELSLAGYLRLKFELR